MPDKDNEELLPVKDEGNGGKKPSAHKDETAEVNAETELIHAKIKNEEAKKLRDLPDALKAREEAVSQREQQADERDAKLGEREDEIGQRERTFNDKFGKFQRDKESVESNLREQKEELVTMIAQEKGQRDEVEVALAYVTDVSPSLIHPDVKWEIARHLEKCLGRWGVVPRYDSRGKYVRTVYRG